MSYISVIVALHYRVWHVDVANGGRSESDRLVHKWQCHFAGTTTVITGNKVRRSMSSNESKRQEVTEQMWYAAEDCSRSVQRRLEKLGRCNLRVEYGKQFVRQSGMQTPSKLRLCRMMKFVSEVWRCQSMKTFVNQNGQPVIYPPYQPVYLHKTHNL